MDSTVHTENEEFLKALDAAYIDYEYLSKEIDKINYSIDAASKLGLITFDYKINNSTIIDIVGNLTSDSVDCFAHFIAEKIRRLNYDVGFSVCHSADSYSITLYIRLGGKRI